MNSNPRIAAAAIYTALFHIGSKPRRTPEKMNGRKVAIKGSAVIAASFVDCMATDTEGISICDSRTSPLGLGETARGAVSGNPFDWAVIVSIAARASARLAATAR